MGPATMTRGFMGLLSESEDHLDDAEVRVRGVRVPPSRVGEPDSLVETDGGLVAFGDLQLELLQRAGAGPVDDRAQERLPRPPPSSFRLHPHAAHMSGLRMLPVEEPEDQAEGATVLLREEHGLAARGSHRLGETDPVGVGLRLLVHEAAGERTGRFGEGTQPELPEKGPLLTLELADAHAGGTPLLRCYEERQPEGERPAVEPLPAFAPRHALELVRGGESDPEEAAVEHGPHYTDGVQGTKDDGVMARAHFDFRAGLRVVRELRTARPSPW